MSLNKFRDEAGEFLKKIGATNESVADILAMLEAELNGLKNSAENPDQFRHQVYDMLFILFELASKFGMDLDMEWEQGALRKKQKYT